VRKEEDILLNILQENQKFDLYELLKGVSIELELIYSSNYNAILKVTDINYLKALKISDEDKELLINILKGLYPDININTIEFAINKKVNFSDFIYIFVDEAGNMDFSNNGSKFYSFTFLVKKRPFIMQEVLQNYKFDLLERAATENLNIELESFHASYDNKFVKDEVFEILENLPMEKFEVYSFLYEKPKILPDKRKDKDEFYIKNLAYSTQKLFNLIDLKRNFIIITDNLPVRQNKKKQIKAFKESIKNFLENKNIKVHYKIFHHNSSSNTNLQIVDYFSWAVFRKYERDDFHYYNKIKKFIKHEELLTKDRTKLYY